MGPASGAARRRANRTEGPPTSPADAERRRWGRSSDYFPGALLGPRKPHKEVIEAFTNAKGDNLRLIFKAQLERRMNYLEKAAAADSRIELVIDDMPTDEHLQLFASCDVCLGPSRWEGLGLFLYEAIAFGMPQITNDSPPMNEVVSDGANGLLVPDHPGRHRPVGHPVDEARRRRADRRDRAPRRPGERERLAAGARSSRESSPGSTPSPTTPRCSRAAGQS